MANSEAHADTRDMYMVHAVFRREFAAMPDLVLGVRKADRGHAQVIGEHIDVLTTLLNAHHRSEDAHLWPRLLDRGNGEISPVVHLMAGHHERIEQLSEEVGTALSEWRRTAQAARGRHLADVLNELTALLYEHMGAEEEHILPLAEKYVTAAEWEELATSTGAALPQDKLALIFGMTAYEADPEVLNRTLDALPPEMRAVLDEHGRQAFAAHSQRVHGTPTPRRSGPLKSV